MLTIIRLVLIILGIGFSTYIAFWLLCIPALCVSSILKFIRIRPIGLLIFGVVSSVILLKYSFFNLIWVIVNIIISIIMIKKHKSIINESKKPNRALKDDFDEVLSGEWACLYAFVIFVPIMFNLNHIFSTHLGTDHMNIIKFYLSLNYGILKYNFVRYGLMLTPLFISLAVIGCIATYGTDALRNLDEEKRIKEAEEKAEKERINGINPDGLDNDFLSQLNEPSDNKEIDIFDDEDNSIDDILDSLN